MATSTEISPEIHQGRETCLPEILKRVPASQLVVCLLVSKKWYSLITSPFFITSHTQTQTQLQSSNLFLIRTFSEKNPLRKRKELYHICSYSPKQPLEIETLTITKKTFVSPFKTESGLQFRMVGSVNGVIFLSDDYYCKTDDFILWNPLVSCYIQVPKPTTHFEAKWMYIYATGFGYDEVNDDYKVVRVVYQQVNDGTYIELVKTPPLAEVYSVKEGEWRSICADYVEYCTLDVEWSHCFLKGNVHWVAYERWGKDSLWKHKSTLLLLFNVVKEKFLKMSLPLELRNVCPLSLMVSDCQGLLCVHHYVKSDISLRKLDHKGFHMWVKKEYNKGTSWIKVASVDFGSNSMMKDIYWRRHGELPDFIKGSKLVSFDPETNTVVMLEKGYRAHHEAWSYAESLAFLNKDCKNRRSFLREKDENRNNDDEEGAPDHLNKKNFLAEELGLGAILGDVEMDKMAAYARLSNQVLKFRRDF